MVLPLLEFRKTHPIKPSQPIAQKIPLLKDYLAKLDDPRQAKGLRHPLTAILSLCCVAMISGAKTPQAVAD